MLQLYCLYLDVYLVETCYVLHSSTTVQVQQTAESAKNYHQGVQQKFSQTIENQALFLFTTFELANQSPAPPGA